MTNDTRTLQQIIDDTVAQRMAEHAAARDAERRAAIPTTEQQLDAARFREQVTQHALLFNVIPSAVRYVVREAASVFELREGALVPLHGATDPGDPLRPLSPDCWLQQLARDEAYLFQPDGRAH